VLRVVAEDIATAYVISEDGRCEPADSEGAGHAAVTLERNRAALTLLCAGRRTFATLPDDAEVTIEGGPGTRHTHPGRDDAAALSGTSSPGKGSTRGYVGAAA